MSFKRHDVQEFIEFDLGCTDLENWKNYATSLKDFTVDSTNKNKLQNCIESDAISFFYKACYSFVQALTNIQRKNYTWSIVQLYYSCFYSIRADILLSNHCIVRCSGLYIAEIEVGEQFQIVRINNIRGDHQMAVALLKRLKNEHKITDEILDIELDSTDAYTWLMKHRERSNYQMKNFSDPITDILFQHIDKYFSENTIPELLNFYSNSDYSICFDTDHAALSIPFKKLMQIKEKIKARYGLEDSQNLKHYSYLKSQLKGLGLSRFDVKQFINRRN